MHFRKKICLAKKIVCTGSESDQERVRIATSFAGRLGGDATKKVYESGKKKYGNAPKHASYVAMASACRGGEARGCGIW